MLEHDFDGISRRVLNLKFMYPTEAARNIDYSKFVSEQDNTIVGLERKMAQLVEKDRPYEEKIVELKEQN